MEMWTNRVPPHAAPGRVVADAVTVPGEALAATKAYLRVESAAEDALIARLIATAIAAAEDYAGRVLLVRTMRETLVPAGGWQRLARAPVVSITAIETAPAVGPGAALATDAFAIDIDAAGDGWVRAMPQGRVRVTYAAGLAAGWSGVPEPLAQGVVRLAAHLFAHRDGASAPMPAAVAALWRPWRRMRLA